MGCWKTNKDPKDHQPDRILPEAWTQVSKKQEESEIAEWAEENAELQAARRHRGIHEVLTDDKTNYFKVIADTRLKLAKDTALALPCIQKNDRRGGTSGSCNFS